LLPTKDLGINLPELLKQVANAKTQGELANILEGLLNNPNLKLSTPAKKYLWEMVSALKDIDHEMKRQEAAAKTRAKQPPSPPQAMAPSMRDHYTDYTIRKPIKNGAGRNIDTRDNGEVRNRLAAVGQLGNKTKDNSNGNGSGSNGNNQQKPQPQKPTMFADANQTNGKPANGNGSYLNAEEAVQRTRELASKHDGNHSLT
jgi:hypothetical protein